MLAGIFIFLGIRPFKQKLIFYMSTLISLMNQDLRLLYRIELVEISQHLTGKQFIRLLKFCKDYIPESDSSGFSIPDEIFGCLEEKGVISYEKVSFLTKFANAIGRRDLGAKLTRFEITRELMIYALNRQGLEATMISSTTSLGHHLAKMMDVVQDGVDAPIQGLFRFLFMPGRNVSDVLDVIIGEVLPGSDTSKSWNNLALRFVTAAEIVWLVIRENQEKENGIKNALQVAKKLASHLWSKMDKFEIWVR
ncbi:uncharacterized protein LOC111327073 [Stylophora pistillata]|uniref:uncharacterized protein LOC111327073 n=1 Tax=Stylophora pistillata TaxID=50429 RepID=UPI000C042640|nr:uncharacterized protein LOC111327073 [Stylophora pistillata]